MISAASFIEQLRHLGYSQFCGVPCSFLKPFINYVIDDPSLDYVGATSEGEAVGFSLGAHLGGRKTVTMCQNSGLGNMVNPLTSLNYPFRVPTLLIVTWRGEPGVKDEPQHEQMGRIMTGLFDTLEIPWRPFPTEESEIASTLAEVESLIQERQGPVALVMSKGAVAPHELAASSNPKPLNTPAVVRLVAAPDQRMTRTRALEIALEVLEGNEASVATTGKTGRELFTLGDRANNLYVVGGMGTASSIGFGVAHTRPARPVVVFDGDGAALMKLGSLATIGHYQPKNFLHLLLDNEVHDSTGGQRTVSGVVGFAEIAAACNYRHAVSVDRPEDFRSELSRLRQTPGPSLLHVKIRPGSPSDLGRPTVKPHEVRDRFMDFIAREESSA